MEILQHFSHEHALTFCETKFKEILQKVSDLLLSEEQKVFRWEENEYVSSQCYQQEKLEDAAEKENETLNGYEEAPVCDGCYNLIDGPAYFCETCPDFWLHQSCASLPFELVHPLHSPHPLNLLINPHVSKCSRFSEFYICDKCRNICLGFGYHCSECQFSLDIQCALSPTSDCQLLSGDCSLGPPQTEAEISHFSHEHTLALFKFNREKEIMDSMECKECKSGCGMPFTVSGLVYGCFNCRFYLHQACAAIPREIQHPFHRQHQLVLDYQRNRIRKFICDECRDVSQLFMASCNHCEFRLDFKCVLYTSAKDEQRSKLHSARTKFHHFSHRHAVHLFNSRNKLPNKCDGCELLLSGPVFGCLDCSFYLHKSCAEAPKKIRHPYHASHPLQIQFVTGSKKSCGACHRAYWGLAYLCFDCDFSLHILCAIKSLKVVGALNHKCHQHNLYYFVADHIPHSLGYVPCSICGKACEGCFYICLDCNSCYHLECIPIPPEILVPDHHMHSLTLMDPLVGVDVDESQEYYCFACEQERDPTYHAYYCQQCSYTAHIECILSLEFKEAEYQFEVQEEDEKEQEDHVTYPVFAEFSNPQCKKQIQIKDCKNDHVLIFCPERMKEYCYGCKQRMHGKGYSCADCEISLHKECAELPLQIKHSLHSSHPLNLVPSNDKRRFTCSGCSYFSCGDISYVCNQCMFVLDIKCASAISPVGDRSKKMEEKERKATIYHFSHEHKLTFAYFLVESQVYCIMCDTMISGPGYHCGDCEFFLHESCCDTPQYIQHPFHLPHQLELSLWGYMDACYACNFPFGRCVFYSCKECNFRLHVRCSKYLTSSFKHAGHKHNFFYFVAKDLRDVTKFIGCQECGKHCSSSFYRCTECKINLHLECIPIPKEVKGSCHIHSLSLMGSDTEDRCEEYYCHACENLRNPKHDIYSCKRCPYTAHIGCVLNEVTNV
ncbi:hypothetical protein K2173_005955 [Erythroxylum novogranatense]|uniref:Phorbol-ester/DAG-type domain-containing protein n=1 Tax=Erythroxylum novogranatense TaxID=1862640 RepID=A0AAV8TUI0_9ROSI|nr:hypothetical protein K2173_005955 [Erythroxylum novogranatense]